MFSHHSAFSSLPPQLPVRQCGSLHAGQSLALCELLFVSFRGFVVFCLFSARGLPNFLQSCKSFLEKRKLRKQLLWNFGFTKLVGQGKVLPSLSGGKSDGRACVGEHGEGKREGRSDQEGSRHVGVEVAQFPLHWRLSYSILWCHCTSWAQIFLDSEPISLRRPPLHSCHAAWLQQLHVF